MSFKYDALLNHRASPIAQVESFLPFPYETRSQVRARFYILSFRRHKEVGRFCRGLLFQLLREVLRGEIRDLTSQNVDQVVGLDCHHALVDLPDPVVVV